MLASSNIRPSVPKVTNELRSLFDDEKNHLIKLRQIQTRHSRSMTGPTAFNDPIAVGSFNEAGGEAADFILPELDKIYDKIEPIDPEYVFLRRGRLFL